MKIANADKLNKHFESVVDVHLFTVPEILTIIETFSIDVPECTKMILPRGKAKDVTNITLGELMCFKSTKKSRVVSAEFISEVQLDD